MNKKWYFLLRIVQIATLIVICIIIAIQSTVLENTAKDLKYQQTEKFAHSLTNLAAAEATRYLANKKNKELQVLMEDLSHASIIRDATIYNDLGEILYQSKNVLPLPDLLKISNDKIQQTTGIIPYIAELYSEENKKIGYIRITLEQDKILGLIQNYQDKSTTTMIELLVLAFVGGIILMALIFRKLKSTSYYTIKTLYRLTMKIKSISKVFSFSHTKKP